MSKRLINEKELKLYDEWNKERYNNRTDKDNIFPIGISDREFVKIITNLFLGSNWYTVDPIGHNQVNEEILDSHCPVLNCKECKEKNKIDYILCNADFTLYIGDNSILDQEIEVEE